MLPLFRDYISQLQPEEGVAVQIKNLFGEIETFKEPVRTSHYVRYLNLLGYESSKQMMPIVSPPATFEHLPQY